MEPLRERASQALPSVLLTLLSMIQALALELLWSRLQASSYLWTLDLTGFVGWLQVATMLMGFLQVWLSYASIAMRFRWVPTVSDLSLPFGIGLLEFTLIATMGPAALGRWFAVLACVFTASIWSSQVVYRQARADPANAAFFSRLSPATHRDFLPVTGVVAVLFAMALVLQWTGDAGWLALVAVAFALVAVGLQLDAVRRYWNLAMEPGDDPRESD